MRTSNELAWDFADQGNQVKTLGLADWGKILLNPTLYGEWKFNEHDPMLTKSSALGEQLVPTMALGALIFSMSKRLAEDANRKAGFSQASSYTLMTKN